MNRDRSRKPKAYDYNYHLPAGFAAGFRRDLEKALEPLTGFRAEYLKSEIFSKYLDNSRVTAEARRDAAISKWLYTEGTNEKTNLRLFMSQSEHLDGETSDRDILSQIVRFARAEIRSLLGRLNSDPSFFDPNSPFWTRAVDQLQVTNGASTQFKRSPTGMFEKLNGDIHISDSAFPHYLIAFSGTQLEDRRLVSQNHSHMFTVDKKDDIDRVACKEPEGNMLLQRAAGCYIRQRLLRVGIDLRDQTNNQRLAKVALERNLATIDLSAASDSITTSLVQLLLPFEWFALLDDLRVPDVKLPDGSIHHMEMFSTMGNGFTFELETLIFYALVRGIQKVFDNEGTVIVYGDDIICPSSIARAVGRFFSFFGFTVNAKKSHWSGPFRESCGSHFHNGCDVTPVYVRKPVERVMDLILVLNSLFRWSATLADSSDSYTIWDPEIAELHKKYSAYVAKRYHGGFDLHSNDALVTGDHPRKRLVPRTKRLSLDHLTAGRLAYRLVYPAVESLPVRNRGHMEQSNRGYQAIGIHGREFYPHGHTGALYNPYLILG